MLRTLARASKAAAGASTAASKEAVASKWETCIGLEIHVQIKAKSKLFSAASADYGVCVHLLAGRCDGRLLHIVFMCCHHQYFTTWLVMLSVYSPRAVDAFGLLFLLLHLTVVQLHLACSYPCLYVHVRLVS